MINKINEYSIMAYEKGRSLKNRVVSILRNKEGQGLVEYALIIALVAVGLVIALGALQVNIEEIFDRIGTALDAA
jgi:pilus assembly protein Flp/PilA